MSWLDDFLSAVVLANGTRVARLGGPTGANLNLSSDFTATLNNATGAVDVALTVPATVIPYIQARQSGAGTTAYWYNDTGASKTLSNLYLIPMNNVSSSGTNYWVIAVNDVTASSVLASITTASTSLSAGVPVSFGPSVSVPAGHVVSVSLTATGSPSTLGVMVQGR